MTAQEAFREILALFYQRLAHDPQARAAMRRVERQTAAFTDTAQLSERASVLLGEVFGAHVLDVPEELREAVCTALLRERYDTMNGILADVQEAADEALGLSLDAAHAPFPAERVQTVAHSLIDPGVTAATIQRRANKPVATVARSFHDDFIETNAKKRSDLGLRCHITRETDGKCCQWCDGLAGRYVYGRHPSDIFRRHDNCGCTVTYEEGRQRQDVWTKRSWERVDPEEVAAGAPEPTVFSREDAAAMEESLLSGLTLAGERDIIKEREREFGFQYGESALHADMDYIDSDEYAKIFSNITDVPEVNKALLDCARAAIDHRNGTKFEDMYFIHAVTGEILASQTEMTKESGITYNDSIKELLEKAKKDKIPLITLHNHPEGYPPSVDDLNKSYDNRTLFGIAAGHNGQVYKYNNPGKRTEGAELIHDNIATLCMLGTDPDRAYQDEFKRYGLYYDILRGDDR
ncbi:MAG: hypothetical protein IKI21_11400 [Oscillospiraceae bacterium]|nr:hypothetical protein [Oscillospiraceae bacterium]